MPKDTTTRFMIVALRRYIEACELHDMANLNDRHLELVERVWDCRVKSERKLVRDGSVIKKTYTHDTLCKEGDVSLKGEPVYYISSRGRTTPSSPSKLDRELDCIMNDATVARYELSLLIESEGDSSPKLDKALARLAATGDRLEAKVEKKAVGTGMPWREAMKKAESYVKKNGGVFPAFGQLVDAVGCAANTMRKAIKRSPDLLARQAEKNDNAKPTGRLVQITDKLSESLTDADTLKHLVGEKADDDRSERQQVRARRRT